MKASAPILVIVAGIVLAGLGRATTHSDPPSRLVTAPLPRPSGGDPRKISLGHDLFFDRRMSRSTLLSCASCHDLSTNGASSARLDRGDTGHFMRFNTPTVFNSAYDFRLGWEGRTRNLNDMALWTLRAEHLMGSRGLSIQRLAADRAIAGRFRAIYGTAPNEHDVSDALASFMTTLVTPDAAFDRWLRGDRTALTAQQVRGYSRFKVLGCVSCHQGVNIGGNLFQRRGIFHPLGEPRPRYLRVPSLRNVSVTAPYFHDGSVQSLPVAIRWMARAQLNLTMNPRDVRDIAAWLDSLTGTYQGHRLQPAATSTRR